MNQQNSVVSMSEELKNDVASEEVTNPVLPSEEPKVKKKNFFLIGVLVFLFLISLGFLTCIFFKKEKATDVQEVEVKFEEKEVGIQENNEIQEIAFEYEKTPCVDFTDFEAAKNYSKELFEKYGISEYVEESKEIVSDSKYGGMRWEDNTGEIGLIKRSKLMRLDIYSAINDTAPSYQDDPEGYDSWMEIRDQKTNEGRKVLPLILDEAGQCFLEDGFVENQSNRIEGILAFEKENLKCLIDINDTNWPNLTLECGDIVDIAFPEGYSEINKILGNKYFASIYNVVGNFAVITRSPRPSSLGGGWSIMQKDITGRWSEVDFRQDYWDCKLLLDLGVPPKLFDAEDVSSICYDTSAGSSLDPGYEKDYKDFYEKFKR